MLTFQIRLQLSDHRRLTGCVFLFLSLVITLDVVQSIVTLKKKASSVFRCFRKCADCVYSCFARCSVDVAHVYSQDKISHLKQILTR